MPLTGSEPNIIKKYLWSAEHVELSARQAKIHKGITPKIIAITNERVIVITRKLLPARTDVDSIPFNDIVAVRLEEGVVFSSVFLRLIGSVPKEGLFGVGTEAEGELSGLSKKDAIMLAEHIEKMITEKKSSGGEAAGTEKREYMYCPKCGAKNELTENCKSCGTVLPL